MPFYSAYLFTVSILIKFEKYSFLGLKSAKDDSTYLKWWQIVQNSKK